MRYRKLSEDGEDYQFGNSQNDFWRDTPEAVGQAAETRLLLFLGEWFLDLTEGTPYLQGILGKHSQEVADLTIQDRIAGTQDLTQISAYSSTLDREIRYMSVSATIDTIYGPTDLTIENNNDF